MIERRSEGSALRLPPEGYYPSGLPLLLRASPNGADAEKKWDSQGSVTLGQGCGDSVPTMSFDRLDKLRLIAGIQH